MKCPNCKLENPDESLRCDCGYDFVTNEIKESYLDEPISTNYLKVWQISLFWVVLGYFSIIIFSISLLFAIPIGSTIKSNLKIIIFCAVGIIFWFSILFFVGYRPKKYRIQTYLQIYKNKFIYYSNYKKLEVKISDILDIEKYKNMTSSGIVVEKMIISYCNNFCSFGLESIKKDIPITKKLTIPLDSMSCKRKIIHQTKTLAITNNIKLIGF